MYEERLRQRGSETEASIARRLETARCELARKGEYQHVIYNDDLRTGGTRVPRPDRLGIFPRKPPEHPLGTQ